MLAKALLDVVSEKTGYPVEMLELTSDMEADLGIDSIKRVEIMGALRAQFPALPQADPEAFAEVRTLGDVVAYLVNRDEAQAETVQPASNGNGNGAHDASLPRGIVGLKALPQPDFSEYHLPENAVCLLTDNGTLRGDHAGSQINRAQLESGGVELPIRAGPCAGGSSRRRAAGDPGGYERGTPAAEAG